jgi:hypothetical protein
MKWLLWSDYHGLSIIENRYIYRSICWWKPFRIWPSVKRSVPHGAKQYSYILSPTVAPITKENCPLNQKIIDDIIIETWTVMKNFEPGLHEKCLQASPTGRRIGPSEPAASMGIKSTGLSRMAIKLEIRMSRWSRWNLGSNT